MISIHAPLTGSDPTDTAVRISPAGISIHAPLTGSDNPIRRPKIPPTDFNPRSPYGERLFDIFVAAQLLSISIHAPLTGSDHPKQQTTARCAISIHAPLTGSDYPVFGASGVKAYFNPRSPYGERLSKPRLKPRLYYFNPRSPYGERPIFLPTLSF